ncbi:AB hydrolase superfamily protein [Colletotrichum siamense]|nr:AB hydrolase superfamily protein [Colletotrichum siamense]
MSANIDDPESWHFWGLVDDELRQMIQDNVARRFPPVDVSKLPSIREAWVEGMTRDMLTLLEAAKNEVSFSEILIPRRDGTTGSALVFRPKLTTALEAPAVVLIHGGGFLFGSAEMEATACIEATKAHGCVSLSLDYRLSPEAKFPVAYEDCWDALHWLTENAEVLGADLTKGFVLGGTSSGGQMAAALSHMARDQSLSPSLTGVYLNATSIVQPDAVPTKYRCWYRSNDENDGKTGLSKKTTAVFRAAVAPDIKSDFWNPLNWSTGHEALPPTYFQVCGADIQRDDGLVYERVLRHEHGLKTKMDMYSGLPHVFWYLYPSHSMCEKFRNDRMLGLGWLLNQGSRTA